MQPASTQPLKLAVYWLRGIPLPPPPRKIDTWEMMRRRRASADAGNYRGWMDGKTGATEWLIHRLVMMKTAACWKSVRCQCCCMSLQGKTLTGANSCRPGQARPRPVWSAGTSCHVNDLWIKIAKRQNELRKRGLDTRLAGVFWTINILGASVE